MPGYPDNFSSLLFAQAWGRDRIEPRDLTAAETRDIATLREAMSCLQAVRVVLDRLPGVDSNVDFTLRDAFGDLGEIIQQLGESIHEIERQPEIEAERAELERNS